MRYTALLLMTAACKPTEQAPWTPWGIGTGTTDDTASSSTQETSGTPALGARITGIDPTNAVSDCDLDPQVWPNPLSQFGNANWEFRTGGSVNSELVDIFGASLEPLNEFWGANAGSTLLPSVTASLTYGYEVDTEGVLVSPSERIKSADAFGHYGLKRGHYVLYVPWLFDFGGGGAGGDSGVGVGGDEATVMVLMMEFGVDETGNLVETDVGGGEIAPPAFWIMLGDSGWSGDTNQTSAYCTLTYYLEGITLQPFF